MSQKKYWVWSNYTKLDQSKQNDREKYVNKEYLDEKCDLKDALKDTFLIEKKEQLLRETKRVSHSLNERVPILQKSGNPMITGNYIDHLDKETEFLRPKNSNFE